MADEQRSLEQDPAHAPPSGDPGQVPPTGDPGHVVSGDPDNDPYAEEGEVPEDKEEK